MRVAIMCIGSRGDAQPMISLGIELGARGHDVVLGLPSDLVSFGRLAGLATTSAGLDVRAFLDSPTGQRWMTTSGNVRKYLAGAARKRAEALDDVHTALLALAEGADVIVTTRLTEDDAAAIAEYAGVPLVCVHFAPWRRNRKLPSYLVTNRRLPAPFNDLTHRIAERAHWKAFAPGVQRLRRRLGVGPVTESTPVRLARAGTPEIQAYGRALVHELADWDPRRPLVGNMALDPATKMRIGEWGIDPELARWLDQGDPPIYVGFGSMPLADPAAMLATVTETCRVLGLRALVGAGWTALPLGSDEFDEVRVVGPLDHHAVLPRCRLAVHHGGAGTTAASIGAGLPTVVCSVFADQPFWGARVERLGVGRWMRIQDVTPRRLGVAVEAMLGSEPVARARQFARMLAEEGNAAARAADIVESSVATRTGVPVR